MLDELSCVVTETKNNDLQKVPTMEEVKEAIMGLNKNSTVGSDGMIGAFFQEAWDIIKEDVCNMVRAFFGGVQNYLGLSHIQTWYFY